MSREDQIFQALLDLQAQQSSLEGTVHQFMKNQEAQCQTHKEWTEKIQEQVTSLRMGWTWVTGIAACVSTVIAAGAWVLEHSDRLRLLFP